jgi:hypothetical protein
MKPGLTERHAEREPAPLPGDGKIYYGFVRPLLFVLWSFVFWGTLVWVALLLKVVRDGFGPAVESLTPRDPTPALALVNLVCGALAPVVWVLLAIGIWQGRQRQG